MSSSTPTGGAPFDYLMPHLLITKGPQRDKAIALDLVRLTEKPLVLGRLAGEADVVLQTYQSKVSRKHISLSYRPDEAQLVVTDLGSANGTTLNGEYLAAPAPLFGGDTIGCGDVELVYIEPTLEAGLPLVLLPGQSQRVYLEDSVPGVARLEVIATDIPYLRLGAVCRLSPKHSFRIGRFSENDLQLVQEGEEALKVSRRHAEIRWANGTYIIRDLGAANPTWVRNNHLESVAPLEDEDVIQIGSTLLQYRAPRLPLIETGSQKRSVNLDNRCAILRFAAQRLLELGPQRLLLPTDRQVLIGRAEGNDLRLFDQSVSRRHARLFFEAQRFMLADLGSANGTRLNGQVIGGSAILQPGDRVQLGEFEFVFEEVEASQPDVSKNGNSEEAITSKDIFETFAPDKAASRSNGNSADLLVSLSEPVMLQLGAAATGEGVHADAGSPATEPRSSTHITGPQGPSITHPLRQIAPFDELDNDTFTLLAPYFKEVQYKPHQEMAREGQNRGAFFVILEGRVSISRALNERQRLVLGELEPGSMYGERSIFADQPFANRLEAITQVRALRLEENTFVRDLSRNRTVLTFFQQQVSAASAINWMNGTLLMRTLSEKTRHEMAKRLRYRVRSAGETLAEKGQPAEEFFLILGGTAKAYVSDSKGREVYLATLEEGDSFGDGIAVAGETYPMTVRAEGMVECYVLTRADFEGVLAKSGDPVASLGAGMGGLPLGAVLNRVGPFMNMPPQLVAKIAVEMRPKFFRKGEIIVRQDEAASAFYIVRTGQVEISFKTSEGETRADMRLGPGKYFGEDALLTGVPRPVTVTAVEDCDLLALYRNKLDDVLKLGESFNLAQYFTKQLRLRFRPKQVLDVDVSEHSSATGEHYYMLSRIGGEQFFRLHDRSYFLWNLMNGDNSLNDLSMAYFLEFKQLDLEGVSNLVGQLQAGGYLEVPTIDESLVNPDKQKPGLFSRLFNWRFEFKNIDRLFDRIYNYGGQVFFWRPLVLLIFAISLVGFGAFLYFAFAYKVKSGAEGSGAFSLLTIDSGAPLWLVIPLALFCNLILHEMAHGLACKSYGRPVLGGGFGWQSGPFLFVNTNEIWRETRRPRIFVNLAGPLCNALIAGACCLLIFLAPNNPALQSVLFQVAAVGYVLVYININPLLETDGYFALLDWWDMPGLRRKAIAYVRRKLFSPAQLRGVNLRDRGIYWRFAWIALGYTLFTLVQYLFISKILLKQFLQIFGNDFAAQTEWLSWALAIVVVVFLSWPLFIELKTVGRDEDEMEEAAAVARRRRK